VTVVVALTSRLSEFALGAVREMLRERGLSVSDDAELIGRASPSAESGLAVIPPVLDLLVREMRKYVVVVVTLAYPRQWSGVLDSFLGPGFRLWACSDEPPDQNLAFAMTDFVLDLAHGVRAGLDPAVATLAGGPELRPNRYELALFLAEAQASRSAGLRGSVGCALIDGVGDVIALGTNEVPRAGGGQYWADSPDDARDVHNGMDPAWTSKMALVQSVLQYTEAERGAQFGDLESLAARFLDHLDNGQLPSHDRAAQTLESLGRVVHAELAALASAARHGAVVVGCEAVVTRPPCRQCLRQLIVTGVSTVRFLGHADAADYPFHADAITPDGTIPDGTTPDGTTPAKVHVAPFCGVTPRGYDKVFGTGRSGSGTLGSALAALVAGDEPVSPATLLGALADRL
jgi:deoxycytidylate deaminase